MTVPEGADNWRTSSYSGQGQDCVEVRRGPGRVDVRDTKDRAGGQLAVAGEVWRALLDVVK